MGSMCKKNKLPAELDLSTRDLLEFSKFKSLCKDCGISLENGISEAYDFILKKHTLPEKSVPIADAIVQFLSSRRTTNCREATIQDYQSYMSWIVDYFGEEREISTITPKDLMALVYSRNKETVRERFAGKLRTFFTYFYTSGLLKKKFPVELIRVEKVKTDERPPVILSVEETRQLFVALPQEPTVLATFTLGAFAGMRTSYIKLNTTTLRVGSCWRVIANTMSTIWHIAIICIPDLDTERAISWRI